MATEEAKLKVKVRKLFKSSKIWFFSPVSRGMGKHGIPDFICCVPITVTQDMVGKRVGLFLGVETKASGKVATPLQEIVINEIRTADGLAFDLRPADLDNLAKLCGKLQGKT